MSYIPFFKKISVSSLKDFSTFSLKNFYDLELIKSVAVSTSHGDIFLITWDVPINANNMFIYLGNTRDAVVLATISKGIQFLYFSDSLKLSEKFHVVNSFKVHIM